MTVRRENDSREHVKLLVAGVAFIATIAALISLSIAIYTKVFDKVTMVTLEADRAGLQLPKYGDVRYNGVLVGQIRKISQEGDKAYIKLGLEPAHARRMPVNLEASILPTTLFGQKYVSLAAPAEPGRLGVADGTLIPSERVHTSVELNQVLARLFPLLRAVRPADLSATLSALATALSGRGEAIGQTLDRLDGYLSTINDHLPTLREDLSLLADVSDAYNIAAPDLVAALGNLTVTSRTITTQKQGVASLLSDLRTVATDGSVLLEQNGDAIIREGDLVVPLMRVLDKYSPQYNCLLRGIAAYKPVLLKTFEGGVVKQYVEFPGPQVRPYDQRDLPEYNDKRGPRCLGLPDDPPIPWPGYDTDNGTDLDNMQGRGTSYVSGTQSRASVSQMYGGVLGDATQGSAADKDLTPTGRRTAAAGLSQASGRPADEVSGLGTLMWSPMADGGER